MKKRIFIIGGIVLAALTLIGGKKAIDISGIVKNLDISLKSIKRIPELFGTRIKSAIDVSVKNPTATTLELATGGAARISRIFVYTKNRQLVATAFPNIDEITVPAFGETILRQIPIEGDLGGLLSALIGGGGTNPDNYIIETEIRTLGATFII